MIGRIFWCVFFAITLLCSGEEYSNKDYELDSGWQIVFLAPPGSPTLNLS